MQSLRFTSHNPEQTQLLGSYLGKLAQRADVLLLTGELGTGKTCLVQGLARGLAVDEYAFSPSFVILRQYRGRLPLYHIDLYRLDSLDEIAGLGLEDYFYGDGVCVIEWAERGRRLLPPDSLLISLKYVGALATGRSIQLKPQGRRYNQLLKQLKAEGFFARSVQR
jgi:tRNA threonylcarbamoyladenosine biosynthesis protein TsaE